MKRYLSILVILCLLLPTIASAADYLTKGTPMPYDGVCVTETNATKLVEDIKTCAVISEENKLYQERVKIQQDMNDVLKKEVETYKSSYEAMRKVVDDQLATAKEQQAACKEMVKQAKPTLMEDAGKIGLGALIGGAIILMLTVF